MLCIIAFKQRGQGHDIRADSGSSENPHTGKYGDLADVPTKVEWLNSITNPKTRRAYTRDVSEFAVFSGSLSSYTCETMKAQAGLLEASLDYLLSRGELNQVLGASAK